MTFALYRNLKMAAFAATVSTGIVLQSSAAEPNPPSPPVAVSPATPGNGELPVFMSATGIQQTKGLEGTQDCKNFSLINALKVVTGTFKTSDGNFDGVEFHDPLFGDRKDYEQIYFKKDSKGNFIEISPTKSMLDLGKKLHDMVVVPISEPLNLPCDPTGNDLPKTDHLKWEPRATNSGTPYVITMTFRPMAPKTRKAAAQLAL